MSKNKIPIANIKDFNGVSSRGFSAHTGSAHTGYVELSGFIVFDGDQYFAYENKCPHTGAPLDWVEHQFLDADKALIQCAMHDARFEIETGTCVFGPCSGDKLTPLSIVVQNEEIFLKN